VSDRRPRATPGGELLTRVLGGITEVVYLPLRMMTESSAGQRATGIVTGMFGGVADRRGDAPSAAMTVRRDSRQVHLDRAALAAAFPDASQRVVVFLHGLVETERSWFHPSTPDRSRTGTDFGGRLAGDLPCTPVYLRYNTGRHVSDNGRELDELLARLVEQWPVPVTDLVLVGHSMGGLVARSATIRAHERHGAWLTRNCRLVCLGTPHTGALLEQTVVHLGALLDRFAATAPLSRILALRSDGIKDLARGRLQSGQRDERGASAMPGPAFPGSVRQCFIAVTLARSENSIWGRLFGDLFVTPGSAGDPSQTAELRWLGGLNHFDLLSHDTVYDVMLEWLRS
jgi:pimeloyl-ACP methyl ester carboxylesterase